MIGNLVDELERKAVIEKSNNISDEETINLNSLIDDVLVEMMEKFSKRNISLRVDIPDQLPLIHADSDAIQQILIHLLNHAGSVTENNGIVSFNVNLEINDQKPSYVLVQVKGGNDGVDAEKGAEIYSGTRQGEDIFYQGSDEKASGMYIVKTLVEAQGGRTWVETEPEMGTTYTVLLPVGDGG